jgi:hypothetical protein
MDRGEYFRITTLTKVNLRGAIIVQTYNRSLGYLAWIPVVLVVLLFSAPVSGDVILATDGNAIPTWQGATDFNVGFLSKKINGHIDYAVYAPGQFSLSFPTVDTIPANNYVYAYQIFNNATPASNDSITGFTVGLDGNEVAMNNGFIGSGIQPSSNYLSGSPPTSSAWLFSSPNRITVGTNSSILYFTSPFAPEFASSSMTAAGGPYAWTGTMPSPVPEPSALLGLAVFGGLFTVVRVLRHKSRG